LSCSEIGADLIGENEMFFKSLPVREYDRVFVIGEEEDFSVDSIKCNWICIFRSTLEAI
jgi:hypothetical protein